jgi:hypothetical protein
VDLLDPLLLASSATERQCCSVAVLQGMHPEVRPGVEGKREEGAYEWCSPWPACEFAMVTGWDGK